MAISWQQRSTSWHNVAPSRNQHQLLRNVGTTWRPKRDSMTGALGIGKRPRSINKVCELVLNLVSYSVSISKVRYEIQIWFHAKFWFICFIISENGIFIDILQFSFQAILKWLYVCDLQYLLKLAPLPMSMSMPYFCTKVNAFDTHGLNPHSCSFDNSIYMALTRVFVGRLRSCVDSIWHLYDKRYSGEFDHFPRPQ